jgi:LPS O-antigen subunit length determinant protein (WzzB/FepE family)
VQIKLGTCTAIAQQLQASKAKLQERMPAFTILQGASVPVKPSGPKRMVFVAAMLFLATVITSLVVCRKHFPEFI